MRDKDLAHKDNNNGHKLTTKQKRLLEVLSNDYNITKKHTELAQLAGMSSNNFYYTLRNPKFILALREARSYILKTALLNTTRTVVKDANDRNYTKRTAAQNLFFEQCGLKAPDHQVNILIDVNNKDANHNSTKDIIDIIQDEEKLT